jgi:hypothetical protein
VLLCLGSENRNFLLPRLRYVLEFVSTYATHCTIAVADSLYRWNMVAGTVPPPEEVAAAVAAAADAEASGGVGAEPLDLCASTIVPPGVAEAAWPVASALGAAKAALVRGLGREVTDSAQRGGRAGDGGGVGCEFLVTTFSSVARGCRCRATLAALAAAAVPGGALLGAIDDEVGAYLDARRRGAAAAAATGQAAVSGGGEEEEAAAAAARAAAAAALALECGRQYNLEELAVVDTLLGGSGGFATLLYPGRLLKYPDIFTTPCDALPHCATPAVALVGITFEHRSGGGGGGGGRGEEDPPEAAAPGSTTTS